MRSWRWSIAVLASVALLSGCAYVSRASNSSAPTAEAVPTASGASDYPSLSSNGQFVVFESTAPDVVPNDTNGTGDVFLRDRSSGAVEAVSVSNSGTLGSEYSWSGHVSPDGRFVAFTSSAGNLVLNDTNGADDVFLRDRQSGTTTRVSVSSSGAQSTDGYAETPGLSSNGRYVVFAANGADVVAGDTNGSEDIFVRDTQAGTTTRVSLGAGGVQANGASSAPSISNDGRYVAFQSDATNLVSGDTNGEGDIFVRDRQAGTTTRVSVAPGGGQATGGTSYMSQISGDGKSVVFVSLATNVVSGDTNGKQDVFVRDLQAGTTSRASVGSDGSQANGTNQLPSISTNGRYVSFTSAATNFPGGGAAYGLVFRRDRTAGTTTLVSRSTAGATAAAYSDDSAISGDGAIVAFASTGVNLAAKDTNGASSDVFTRDVANNKTDTISRYMSVQGDNSSTHEPGGAMSGDGRYVVFSSYATNLVPGDTNGKQDVFVRDQLTGATEMVSVESSGYPAGGDEPAISSDGRYVTFRSSSKYILPSATNGLSQVFRRDRQTGVVTLVSATSAGVQGNSYSGRSALSGDGRYIAFESQASNFASGDTNGFYDIYVRDTQLGTITKISGAPFSEQGNGDAELPSISNDGRYVAFPSESSNLVADDDNGEWDTFVYDRQTSSTTRVSVGAGGVESSDGGWGRISGDGRFIVFSSGASNLVAGDTNATTDVFVRDRQTSTTTRVSVGPGGVQANSHSHAFDISADGRYVVFVSFATNLVGGDTNGVSDVFVRDRTGNITTRMSTGQFLAQGDNASGSISGTPAAPAISGDGRYVAMWTYATNLVTPDDNDTVDVVVHANPVPIVSSASPTSVARGGTATITVNGSSFLPGVQPLFGDGITVTAVNRVSDTQVKFSISVAAGAATGTRAVLVYLLGTGPGPYTGAAGQFSLNVT
jgi:hypothetical protein